jgi:hypothetical protein
MNQLRTCAGALAALAALLTGCAAASAQPPATTQPPATGHLAGHLLLEGGALGPDGQQPGERPIPGTVTFAAAGHRQVSVQVGSSGIFSAWLPVGRYRVSGRSPYIETVSGSGAAQVLPCSQPFSAAVPAGRTTTIAVTCIVP